MIGRKTQLARVRLDSCGGYMSHASISGWNAHHGITSRDKVSRSGAKPVEQPPRVTFRSERETDIQQSLKPQIGARKLAGLLRQLVGKQAQVVAIETLIN